MPVVLQLFVFESLCNGASHTRWSKLHHMLQLVRRSTHRVKMETDASVLDPYDQRQRVVLFVNFSIEEGIHELRQSDRGAN